MPQFFESLEGRQLLSAAIENTTAPYRAATVLPASGIVNTTAPYASPFNLIAAEPVVVATTVTKSGTLLIEGTTQNDSITVSTSKPSGTIHVVGGKVTTGDSILYVLTTTGKEDTNFAVDSSLVKRIQIDGGAGNDSLSIQGINRKGLLIGGKGNDNLFGGKLGDTLSGGAGNDVLEAAVGIAVTHPSQASAPKPTQVGGKLFIPGTAKTTAEQFTLDSIGIDEEQDSADFLQGGKGNDTLHSGNGPDTMDGGAGNDVLIAQDRGTVPNGLTTAGETPVDYNGLTVISIEAASPTAVGATIKSIFGAGGMS